MGTQGDGKAGSILGVDSLMFAFFPYSRLPVITLLWGAVLRTPSEEGLSKFPLLAFLALLGVLAVLWWS
jgi:hypothetical protein